MPAFTHLDENGHVRMVDVSEKEPTLRCAMAQGVVKMKSQTFDRLQNQKIKKGNVLETARIAGIMGGKKTSELIPMCHPIHITHVQVDFFPDRMNGAITIKALVRAVDHTGVEMEALTAVSVAALTIYDMCKSYDREMMISDIGLLEKTGGKSGHFRKT
jgi:cyclic pyranopterin phosphate synthase